MSDYQKLLEMWRDEKQRRQMAEGELSIVKGIGNNSPEMKKKPSEPLIIGGKRYYKYKIVWEDIVGDSTLATENEFSNMTCAEVHTECWIFNKDVDYVYSFASYFTENGEIEFGDRNIYPRSVIKKMVRI